MQQKTANLKRASELFKQVEFKFNRTGIQHIYEVEYANVNIMSPDISEHLLQLD